MSVHPIGSSADALGISENAFSLLRDLIEARLGIFYDDGKRDLLSDKLAQLIVGYGFQSFLDYYYALKYDADSGRYWSELMDRLSVPETYFWRQPDQIQALVGRVVPCLLQTQDAVRIWSAACCTGEEPLSIAMALTEAGLFPDPRVRIIASDASQAMIQKARTGSYGERSLRNLPPGWRDRFFHLEKGRWMIDRRLHDAIDWRVVNLLDPTEVTALPRPDVAFCRNVLIYFSDAAIQRVVATFSHHIPPNGMLFVGAAESLTRFSTSFMLEEIDNAFVYVNRSGQKDDSADH